MESSSEFIVSDDVGKHRIMKAIISFLDVFVALLIIFTATSISGTLFGRISLVFGFTLLAISIIVRFMQLW